MVLDVLQDRFQQTWIQEHTELSASLSWIRGCDDLVWRVPLLEAQETLFEVRSKAHTTRSQGLHRCERKDIQTRQDRRHVQGTGVAELEAAGTRNRHESVLHAEAAILVTSPPTAQARAIQ